MGKSDRDNFCRWCGTASKHDIGSQCKKQMKKHSASKLLHRSYNTRELAAEAGLSQHAIRQRAVKLFSEKDDFKLGSKTRLEFTPEQRIAILSMRGDSYPAHQDTQRIRAKVAELQRRADRKEHAKASAEAVAQKALEDGLIDEQPRFQQLHKLSALIKRDPAAALKLAKELGPSKNLLATPVGSFEEKESAVRAYIASQVSGNIELRNAISEHSKTLTKDLTNRTQRLLQISNERAEEVAMAALFSLRKDGEAANSNSIEAGLRLGRGLGFPLRDALKNTFANLYQREKRQAEKEQEFADDYTLLKGA